MSDRRKIYLFVHVIWIVHQQQKLLVKPVRTILFADIRKRAEERGIKILAVNGVEDHMHCILQLHPAQNLLQVAKSIKTESSQWLNENKLLSTAFEWEEEYAAYSVSPSAVNQVIDYINKQEDHHKTKTLEKELEVFEKLNLPG
ncbi:MAG: transposase [Bacteroidetes bacterium]|nr:transposase [Bacteroidota bacterium]